MPIHDFSTGSQKLARYDVVCEHSKSESRFVKHVGLVNREADVQYGERIDVAHMKPPFEVDGKLIAHAAGYVPLKISETRQIEVWIRKIRDEYCEGKVETAWWRQYIIRPPWQDCRDPNTGVRRYRRYSCAGFVLDGHRKVDIELLEINEETLPKVNAEALAAAYPDAFRTPAILQRFGIHGDGPWRIVLASYVLHALNRPTEEIRNEPYRAQPGDEHF